MAVKDAILKAKIESEIVELFVKTGVDNVYLDDTGEETLASKLTEMVTAINGKAASNHTHTAATTSAAGFMSAADKSKLDDIAKGANKTTVDAALSATSTNPVQNKAVQAAIAALPTTASVNQLISAAIDALIAGAPGTYDTLKEIADYLTTHEDEYTALVQTVGGKVDKVSGKGLSTNDYTTTEKDKLADIAAGAQVNVIEQIKVNNVAQTVSGKAVNITVPTGALAGKNEVSEADLDEALAEKVNAASEGNHSHSNKAVLDGITSAKVTAWDGKAKLYVQASEPAGLTKNDFWIQIIE